MPPSAWPSRTLFMELLRGVGSIVSSEPKTRVGGNGEQGGPPRWSQPLEQLLAGWDFRLSPNELQRLKALGVKTLGDLWLAGSPRRLERDAKLPLERAEKLIDYSRLALITSNTDVIRRLATSGFRTLHTISRTDLSILQKALPRVERNELRSMQTRAGRVLAFIKEGIAATAGQLASYRSGYAPFAGKVRDDIASLFPSKPTCGACKACKSAFSPAGYLTDLLDFLADNVAGPPFIPWESWEDRFLQPLTKLPLDCDAVDLQVRQARIAVEVLERFILRGHPGLDRITIYQQMSSLTVIGNPPGRPTALLDMFDAYLNELGTTRAEVAAALAAPDAAVLTDLAVRLNLTDNEVQNQLALPAANLRIDTIEALVPLVRKAKPADQAAIALDRIEAQFITILRDNLVRLALRADSTYRTAKALGNFLHIDLSADACDMTTRVAQAIATIHSFLQAFRLGREGAGGRWPIWQERRWRWMQSYGTWHAAMMVYLYPENFAFPGVRRDQTPQFQQLRTEVEENPTPSDIKTAVATYRDVVELLPHGASFIASVDNRVFLFATRPNEVFVGELKADGEWSGWERVELTGENLLGAVGFNGRIYLFFKDKSEVPKKFEYTWFEPGEKLGTKLEPTSELKTYDYPLSGMKITFVSGPEHIAAYFVTDAAALGWAFVGFFMNKRHEWQRSLEIFSSQLNGMSGFKGVGHLAGKDWILARDNKDLWLIGIIDPIPSHPPGSSNAADRLVISKLYNDVDVPDPGGWLVSAYDGTVGTDQLVIAVGRGSIELAKIGLLRPGETMRWSDLESPVKVMSSQGLATVGDAIIWNTVREYVSFRVNAFAAKLLTSGRLDCSLNLPIHPIAQGENRLDEYATREAQLWGETAPGDLVRLYLQEWFFFIPLLIAQSLNDGGRHQDAVDWLHLVYYPYHSDPQSRPVYVGLREPHLPGPPLRDTVAWQEDPFDPHTMARKRPGALIRHTLLAYIGILLDWADRLFARDTSESTNRARELYELALDMLGADELTGDRCRPRLEAFKRTLRHSHSSTESQALEKAITPLGEVDNPASLENVLARVEAAVASGDSFPARLESVRQLVAEIGSSNGDRRERLTLGHLLAARTNSERWLEPERVLLSMIVDRVELGTFPFGPTPHREADTDMWWVPDLYVPPELCVPTNPLLDIYRFRAESNVAKINTCRNFGGLKRKLQPYVTAAAPEEMVRQAAAGDDDFDLIASEPPPVYRYNYLLERARYLVTLAKTTEHAMQTALEQKEVTEYELERAKDELKLAQTHIRLQEMNVSKAQDDLRLAQLQKDKVAFQRDHWNDLLKGDLLGWEHATLALMVGAAAAHSLAALAYTGAAAVGTWDQNTAYWRAQAAGQAFSAAGSAASAWASWSAQVATFERRTQEWRFQRDLAMHDVVIADQGISIAEDLEAIATQQRDIAALTGQFAEDTVSFLTNQFFNQELYAWMARTLRGIYRQYLSTAIAVARMAQQALSFERQEPISIIMPISEYWHSERKGLLAAELLELDLAKLDTHRENTEQRKRQLTKIISLGFAAPVEFQRLRDTGLMEFTTLLKWFDRDFPGHYLRLIKSVSLTFVALIPPTEGVQATLSNSGLSRIMTGPPYTAAKEVLHQPEAVSVTVSNNGTGLFEVNLNDPMLLPFEGRGVETTWTLELPPGANRFDFRSMADVLMTIRYTALDDWGYRQLLLSRMGTEVEDLVTRRKDFVVRDSLQSFFSARHRFADEWYDFSNPTLLSATPGQVPPFYTIRFDLRPEDFPPNRKVNTLSRVTAVVGGIAPSRVPVEVSFRPVSGGGPYTVTGDVIEGRLTLSSVPALPLDTLTPMGVWTVRVRNETAVAVSPNYAALFTAEELSPGRRVLRTDWITDILLVVEYRAETRYPV